MSSDSSIEWMTPTDSPGLDIFNEMNAELKQEIADAFSPKPVLSGHMSPNFHLQAPKITDPGWLPVKVDIARMALDPDKGRLIEAMVGCLKRNLEAKNGPVN